MRMRITIGLLLLPGLLDGALYYTPSEYRELENEKYVLELELKHLNERFINERLQLREKIRALEARVRSLEEESNSRLNEKLVIARESNEKIVQLESRLADANTRLSDLQKEKEENERLARLRIEDQEKQLELLRREATNREQELIDEKKRLEKNLLSEIDKLKSELHNERESAKKKLEDLAAEHRRKTGELEKRIIDLQTRLNNFELENRRQQQRIVELENIREKQKQELERLAEQAKSLEEKLAEEIRQGGIKLKRLNDRLVINMDNKILFDSGSATLRSDEIRRTLDKISDILAKYPDNRILVEGHTDDVPIRSERFRDNWQLSTERALSVLYHLLRNRNLDPSRYMAVGAGQFQPLVPNTSPENRALNRRVDIVVMPRLAE